MSIPAVYPRWRGELHFYSSTQDNKVGLSPLARGTQVINEVWEERRRFIPAGAGNSIVQQRDRALSTVYPRWRGELHGIIESLCGVSGLSPLARGTQRLNTLHGHPSRFIPAGAGNS